mmetsp:Transcript_23788/g.52008  ORF Transcript_23788/g.52008 Transcript_23788/m.52008 type:complete len:890 (+) Transcript_23788:208-2877(+)
MTLLLFGIASGLLASFSFTLMGCASNKDDPGKPCQNVSTAESSRRLTATEYCGFATTSGKSDAGCSVGGGNDGCSVSACLNLDDCKAECDQCGSCTSFDYNAGGPGGFRCWMKKDLVYSSQGYTQTVPPGWGTHVNNRDSTCAQQVPAATTTTQLRQQAELEPCPAPSPAPSPSPNPSPSPSPQPQPQSNAAPPQSTLEPGKGTITTSTFDAGAKIAQARDGQWTLSTMRTGRAQAPFQMQSAACGRRLFVGWTAQGDPTQGYVSELLEAESGGSFTTIRTTQITGCEAVYGVTATTSCEYVALLCRSSQGPSQMGATSLAGTPGGWDWGFSNSNCAESSSELAGRHDNMYLVEWKSSADNGGLTEQTTVHLVSSIGGAEYGHQMVAVDGSVDSNIRYYITLKVTLCTHEGDYPLLVARDGWTRLQKGRGCSTGHTYRNLVTYNEDLDVWGRVMQGDGSYQCDEDGAVPGQCSKDDGGSYCTDTAGSGKAPLLYGRDQGFGGWAGNFNIVANGMDGFLASGLGPGDVKQSWTVRLIKLPAPQQIFDRNSNKWMHFDLNGTSQDTEPCMNGPCENGVAFVNLQHLTQDRFLIGWATDVNAGKVGTNGQYFVQEVRPDGCMLGEPFALSDFAGWGEDNLWARMPSSGCIAMPFTWVDGSSPGRAYTDATASSALRVTTYCPPQQAPQAQCIADVDECATGAHDCSPLGICTNYMNRPGGINYQCSCKKNDFGDGKTCAPFLQQFQSGIRFLRQEGAEEWGGMWYAWDVNRVELYSDTACQNRIDVKACAEGGQCQTVGSSSSAGYYSPDAAFEVVWGCCFGGRVDPDSTEGKVIWVGAVFKSDQPVQCAKLKQENNNALAKKIRVDRLNNGQWETVKIVEGIQLDWNEFSW